MADQSRLMTGMFRDRESREDAYGCLTNRGYTKHDVTLLMSDETRRRHFSPTGEKTELGTKAAEGGASAPSSAAASARCWAHSPRWAPLRCRVSG